ncbi:MAG: hypothetical protein U0167_19505 [bacterium]
MLRIDDVQPLVLVPTQATSPPSVTALDIITLAIAAVGAFLGVMNTWRAFNQDRVKLKVTPKYAFSVGGSFFGGNETLCIDIVNRSTFPVTISGAGILLKGTKDASAAFLVNPIMEDRGRLPRRLEPRESLSVYFSSDVLDDHAMLAKARGVFARTACGHMGKGTSPYLRQLAKQARKKKAK